MPKDSIPLKGEVLARARLVRGYNQETLAALADCSKRRVVAAEAGEPIGPEIARALARAVGLPLSELIADASPAAAFSQLPARPGLLIGRERDISKILGDLEVEIRSSACQVRAITAVRGWPGVGKTSLAAELLHRDKTHELFPDYGLWTSLGPSPNIKVLLSQWSRAVGDPHAHLVDDIVELSRRLAGHVQHRRMLLVIDDVWEPVHARPFFVGGPKCAILVTTRSSSVAEDLTPSAGNRYLLDVLTVDDSVSLLRALAPDAVARDPDGTRALAEELQGLPLALQVAGRVLESESKISGKAVTVQALLQDVRNGAKRILNEYAPSDMADLLNQATPSVAALLKRSTDALNHEQRVRFACLSLFPAKPATFDLEGLAATWGVSREAATETVRDFVRRGLLEPSEDGRFRIHALLRAFAKALANSKE